MAEDVICKITRTGVSTPIANKIVVLLSKISPLVAAQQGVDPLLYSDCHTTMLPMSPQLIRFGDFLTDLTVTDTITGTNRIWQIISDPSMDVLTGDWKFAVVRTREV